MSRRAMTVVAGVSCEDCAFGVNSFAACWPALSAVADWAV